MFVPSPLAVHADVCTCQCPFRTSCTASTWHAVHDAGFQRDVAQTHRLYTPHHSFNLLQHSQIQTSESLTTHYDISYASLHCACTAACNNFSIQLQFFVFCSVTVVSWSEPDDSLNACRRALLLSTARKRARCVCPSTCLRRFINIS